MSSGIGYDTTRLREFQDELKRLNAAAIESGLLPAPPEEAEEPVFDDDPSEISPDKGKARAARLLKIAGRGADDTSSIVPGTSFTEAGVVRLIAHLRKRKVRRFPFLRRLHHFLTLPVSSGHRTSAGISIERLQSVSRQLEKIKALGWDRYVVIRDGRRLGQSVPPREPTPATPRSSKTRREARPPQSDAAKSKAANASKPKAAKVAKTSSSNTPTRKAR